MEENLSGKKRRSVKGYLIRPRQQLRLTLAMLSTVIVLLAVLAAWFMSQVNQEIQAQQIRNPLVAQYLQESVAPALRHIQNLQERNFSTRIHLRKGDEFAEIADALNELAESLPNRP
jgi:methyl-accepting chemotaxis protein